MHAMVIPLPRMPVCKAAQTLRENDKEWTSLQNSAVTLAESGNLLMIDNRAKDKATWTKMSRAMVDAAVNALQAVEAKNVAGLSTAGDQLYETNMRSVSCPVSGQALAAIA